MKISQLECQLPALSQFYPQMLWMESSLHEPKRHLLYCYLGDKNMNAEHLQHLANQIEGSVIKSTDSSFHSHIMQNQWNEINFSRTPDAIVFVKNEADVIKAMQYANQHKLKVAIRGGGHSWCSYSLRQGGLLIDLFALTEVSIDTAAQTASIQPINSNQELMRELVKKNLAFLVGHCPKVKASGYLLSGGMPWNQPAWGPACMSVTGLDVVTAKGELLHIDQDHYPDLFWAARGAGSGFFAIATRYYLKLYPLPKTILSSVYFYSLDDLQTVTQWISTQAKLMPSCVELSIFLMHAPNELASQCQSHHGKVCMITASAFTHSKQQAVDALNLLEECPLLDKCLSKSILQPNTFDKLMNLSEALWPAKQRCLTETAWIEDKCSDTFMAMRDHFMQTPSEKNVFLTVINTGGKAPLQPADAAFSMISNIYAGIWSMWDHSNDDSRSFDWHSKAIEIIDHVTLGYYIGETDIVRYPHHIKKSFAPENWQKLQTIRKKYDPDRIFFDFEEAIT